jgi:prevent-host-death family protein
VITVNVHEAKTHLSRLLESVQVGEEIIIARAGHPVARLTAIPASTPPARTGFLAGGFTVPEDFDTMGEVEVTDLFAGLRPSAQQ